ncbi:MAG: NAD(P)H-quinone oxidoreductase [SAR202 cluster bacterium]|nr:NAD(P)H-quinone oxidoreductase [SAR202 cluster bacterium]
MRAAVIVKPTGPDGLRLQDEPDPLLGPEDLLVDVKATALNRADLSQVQGNYPAPAGVRNDIPGLEMSGVVLKVGPRAFGFKEGDRVFALLSGGGYASRVALHHRMALPISPNLDFRQAAAVPEVFFTAFDALFNHCNLKMGESALIHAGGSGVGTAAIQLAKRAGAFTFATLGSDDKLAKAKALGLDVGINYNTHDFAQVIKERTQGRGVDVILDVIGAPYWTRNLTSLAVQGRMVIVGTLGGGDLPNADLRQLMPKRLQVKGTVLRARPLEEKIALTRQFDKHVLPHLASGAIKPVIDRVFPLSHAPDALKYMSTNANFGKIVLSID